jgi:L-alanine-DL-glutamate epimerase-like enolase superfamily enzyme
VRLDTLTARELRVPFKTLFRHASASRSETSSVWVEARAGGVVIGQGESCPRPYVTDETVDSALAFVARYNEELSREVATLDDLRAWMDEHRTEIDRHPAAWCAVELALLDAFGREAGHTVEAVLGLAPLTGRFRYTAVVGDDDPEAFHALVRRYAGLGFRDFKVKLSGDVERDRQKLSAFAPIREEARVRGDANNVWTSAEAAISALRRLAFDFAAIEEPLPSRQYGALASLAAELGCAIVLDESVTRAGQLRELAAPSSQWIVNVRVSKMGGLLRSLEAVEAARVAGIGVIVGAQVGETSLLTRAGLTVASAAGPSLVAQEGAFGTHLLAEDVCDPPLMFGAGGVLEVSAAPILASSGLGRFTPNPAWLR